MSESSTSCPIRLTAAPLVLEEGGYLTAQDYDYAPLRNIIPRVTALIEICAQTQIPVIFTREGHRPDLSTLSSREKARSRVRTGVGIGDKTTSLGRALIRGEPGHDIIPELVAWVAPSETNVIDKPGRSAFAHTDLELILRNMGVVNLLICGVTTDVCVHSTMREANDRAFDCVLVADACAAGAEELHDWAVDSIQGEGGIFGSVTDLARVKQALSTKG